MLTTKKNRAMNTGGMTAVMSLGMARNARPAMEMTSRANPACRGRIVLRRRLVGRLVVSTVAVTS
jgi:hypothetical protein